MTQELTELGGRLQLTGVFKLTAKKLENTNNCQILLPCRYNGKSVTIAVYEDQ